MCECFIRNYKMSRQELSNILEQMMIVGPGSLNISLMTAFFVGLVFSLQVVKELLYLGATGLVGAVLALAFVRELSPVLTSVIVIGRIGSSFTAELATMKVTEQLDALYLLDTNPLFYLVVPRVVASICILPILNIFSFATSLASSSFICFILYNIDPIIFFTSCFSALSFSDIIKSLLKTIIFGFFISIISCSWGILATGGAKGVGKSTTASVVTCLLSVFILDFIFSYFMFSRLDSSIKAL
uniref:ABC transporter permease n=1 Tax=Sebdenia flabellata TaxID=42024 RepID=A0A1C9C9Y4_9FLOR|nr:hypothetical protein Sebd_106 [Sebdenia flabellata]AOM65193.1 hypothetical protein Sebd_106 [Sebdenia flabellata]